MRTAATSFWIAASSVAQLTSSVTHRIVAFEESVQLGIGLWKAARRKVDVGVQDVRFVLVGVLELQPLQLVDRIARAVVVLGFVASRRGLVQGFGQIVGVVRDQIVIVARVVEAILLVRDATQTETRQITHSEEVRAAEKRRLLRRLFGIGHLAEQRLALLVVFALDRNHARKVGGLRPETRFLRDGLRRRAAHRRASDRSSATRPVKYATSPLTSSGAPGPTPFKSSSISSRFVALEREVDQAVDRAAVPNVARRSRQQLSQVAARRLIRTAAAQCVPEPINRGAPLVRVLERIEARRLDDVHQIANGFVPASRTRASLRSSRARRECARC